MQKTRCKNPECGKEIPDGLQFCSKDCMTEYKGQDKDLRKRLRLKHDILTSDEKDILIEGIGKEVEFQMSRGPPVRGVMQNYDPEFQKVIVSTHVRNNQRKTTMVKLSYVSSWSVYEKNEG